MPKPAAPDYQELGATGLWRAGGFVLDDILPQLRGLMGIRAWRDMSENDSTVGSVLFAIERMVQQVEWHVDPYMDPDATTAKPDDEATAKFVDECRTDMSHTWQDLISGILTMLPYGWSWHEIVYKQRIGPDQDDPTRRSQYTDGKIGWRKMALRAQDSLWQWQFDEEGGVQAMVQRDPATGHINTIPIEKSLLFRTTVARGNPEGRSVLRSAFKSWYYKRLIEEIEAVGVERDLAGLPVAFVPPVWLSSQATAAEKQAYEACVKIVRGVKRNEQEGVVFPMHFDEEGHQDVDFKLLSSGGARQFDTGAIIERYNASMAMTVLADFVMLGHEGVGSFALSESKIDLFIAAVASWTRLIAEVFNKYAIPRLLKLNGMDVSRCPTLEYGELGMVDLAAVGLYLQQLSAAGVLTPDATLEAFVRDLAGLPAPDSPEDVAQYKQSKVTTMPGASDDPNSPVTQADGDTGDGTPPAQPDSASGADTTGAKKTPAGSSTNGAAPNLNGATVTKTRTERLDRVIEEVMKSVEPNALELQLAAILYEADRAREQELTPAG